MGKNKVKITELQQSKVIKMDNYTLHTDGACIENPGGLGACSYIIKNESGEEIKRGSLKFESCTSNEAEFMGLLIGLKEAVKLRADRLVAYTDSKLLARQVQGCWKCKAANLQKLLAEIRGQIKKFVHFEVRFVRREFNQEADAICEQVICEVLE